MNSGSPSNTQQFVFKKGNISLRITSDTLLVCSNKFRQHLAQRFDIRGIFLVKTGPQRKYFREGVLRLASSRGLPGSLSFSFPYKSHVLTLHPVSEEEAGRCEAESHKKMYVGGVGPHTSVQEVEDYFGYFGPVAFVQLMGMSKSEATRFGFVIFEDHRAMAEVYQYGPHFLHGYRLRVTDYVNNSRNKKKKKAKSQRAVDPDLSKFDSGSMLQAAGKTEVHAKPMIAKHAEKKIIRRLPTPVEIIVRNAAGQRTHFDRENVRFNLAVPHRFIENRRRLAPHLL